MISITTRVGVQITVEPLPLDSYLLHLSNWEAVRASKFLAVNILSECLCQGGLFRSVTSSPHIVF